MPAQYGPQKFSEAITHFRNKLNMPSERWADVWREQHNNAFMVAGATKTDLLADISLVVERQPLPGGQIVHRDAKLRLAALRGSGQAKIESHPRRFITRAGFHVDAE